MNASLLSVCEQLRADPVSACARVIGNICWKGSVCVVGFMELRITRSWFPMACSRFLQELVHRLSLIPQALPSGLGHMCPWERAASEAGPYELLLKLVPAWWGEYFLMGICESCLSKCLSGFMLTLQSSAGSVQRAGSFLPYPGMELSPCSFPLPGLTCTLSSFESTRKILIPYGTLLYFLASKSAHVEPQVPFKASVGCYLIP